MSRSVGRVVTLDDPSGDDWMGGSVEPIDGDHDLVDDSEGCDTRAANGRRVDRFGDLIAQVAPVARGDGQRRGEDASLVLAALVRRVQGVVLEASRAERPLRRHGVGAVAWTWPPQPTSPAGIDGCAGHGGQRLVLARDQPGSRPDRAAGRRRRPSGRWRRAGWRRHAADAGKRRGRPRRERLDGRLVGEGRPESASGRRRTPARWSTSSPRTSTSPASRALVPRRQRRRSPSPSPSRSSSARRPSPCTAVSASA